MIDIAIECGVDRVELYTGFYAKIFNNDKINSIKDYITASEYAIKNKLEVNAGHDLDLKNLSFLKKSIPNLYEVSIGHALICDSLYYGLEKTIKLYLSSLK